MLRQWTWKQVADALDLSVTMLFMVKAGRRGLSTKAEYRLRQQEVEAGIAQNLNGSQMGFSDHEDPPGQYDPGPTAEELLDRIYRKDKTAYEHARGMLAGLDHLLDKKPKRKKMR